MKNNLSNEQRIDLGWTPSEPDEFGCILWLHAKSPHAIVTDAKNRCFACPILQINELLTDMRELNKKNKKKTLNNLTSYFFV